MTQTDNVYDTVPCVERSEFHFYAPDGETKDKCLMLKGKFQELVALIEEHVTRVPDKERAISRLRQAFYWASCSILDIEETQG